MQVLRLILARNARQNSLRMTAVFSLRATETGASKPASASGAHSLRGATNRRFDVFSVNAARGARAGLELG
jgi:hypothetical protein